MKLTLYTIDALAGILLSGVNISKMEDRKAKRVLMDEYVAMRKLCKDALADQNEIVSKLQSDLKDEPENEEALRQEAQEALDALFSREAEVNIVPVKKEAVADFFVGNLEQWAVLLENGIIDE